MTTLADLPPPVLSPWQMVLSADLVVQSVMALLVLASVLSWTVLLAKVVELAAARRRLRIGLGVLRQAGGLHGIAGEGAGAASGFLAAAEDEMRLSSGLPAEGVKDRIALRLRRIEHALARRLARGTGLLASIGSCAPFVGLFGTVWGIMNSFVGISQAQTTNLAVVAPGIAEALLATAFGLGAAIPAVLIYNGLARALAGYKAGLGDLSALVLAHAARDLDRGLAVPRPRARPELLSRAAE
ncbi:Ton complex subunit ExbB [Rhodovastum atsumiense]|nr:tonB-system energizer ExbB [Rhodovastum atsumiense]CAH2601825.1 Ton complex subunit ExbB [Rhodovastum atsumiense]